MKLWSNRRLGFEFRLGFHVNLCFFSVLPSDSTHMISRVYLRRNQRDFGMELKETKVEMDDSVNKDIGVLPVDIQEKSMQCTSNFEDHSFYNVEDHTDEDHCDGVDASGNKVVEEEEEDEVDILECRSFNDKNEIEVSECNDGTDDVYSSSFSGTVSDHENETSLNDQEADSMICTDTSLPFWLR